MPVSETAPAYEIESEVGRPAPDPEYVDDDRGELLLRSGGRILIDRTAGRVSFVVPHEVRPDELVHPYLAPAAAVIGRWHGRESIHAGAFAVDGDVWGLVGEREAGKSSTLAWLAQAGVDVLCDDMLVIDGRTPFRGPRSIDLRADAAERFEGGEAIGVTGARERWRLRLDQAPDGQTLAGLLLLTWGDRVEVRALGASERLAAARPAARRAPGAHARRGAARPRLAAGLGAQPAAELGIAAGGGEAAARTRVHTDCRSVMVWVSGCGSDHSCAQHVDVDELRVDALAVPAEPRAPGWRRPHSTWAKCALVERRSTSAGSRSPTRSSIAWDRDRCRRAGGSAASAARKRGSWSGCAIATSWSAASAARPARPCWRAGEPSRWR